MDKVRADRIERIAWIAIGGNLFLAIVKILGGVLGGSMAVLGDGIDSTTDVVAAGITVFAARIIAKPPDHKHPYGHFRAETIATKTLAFIIFFVGAQLGLSTVRRIFSGEYGAVPEMLAVYAAVFSVGGKVALAYVLIRSGRKLDSSMLIANGKNMQSDVVISGGVLVGLALTHIFQAPVLDAVAALGVSLWILWTAFGIFMESTVELMDGIEDGSIYTSIFQAVDAVPGAANPHRTRVRRLANMCLIDLDIEVDGSMTVSEGHAIAVRVEEMIKQRLDNVYDIMIHVEPLGNIEQSERYGLTDSPQA